MISGSVGTDPNFISILMISESVGTDHPIQTRSTLEPVEVDHPIPQTTLVKPISVKKKEVINTATGKIKYLQIILRSNESYIKATIGTGSPASFINKRAADILLKSEKMQNWSLSQNRPLIHSMWITNGNLSLFTALLSRIFPHWASQKS